MKVSPDLIRRRILDKNPAIGSDAKIGVVSSFCKEQAADDQPNGTDILMVATTSDIDLDSEVVVPEGARTDYFFQNRSIFVDHMYDFEHCIGKLRSASPIKSGGVQTGWRVRFHVPPLEKNPDAADIVTFAKDGALSSSIGFTTDDVGPASPEEKARFKQGGKVPQTVVRTWDWLELSVTMFPCNVNAAQVGFSSAEEKEFAGELAAKRMEYLRGMLSKGFISTKTCQLFGLDKYQELRPKKVISAYSPVRVIPAYS